MAFCSTPISITQAIILLKLPSHLLLNLLVVNMLSQALDDSFARATPKYEAQKSRQKRDAKNDSKKKNSRPVSGGGGPLVRAPSSGSSVGPIGPSMKMKANPGMAMAMAQSGELILLCALGFNTVTTVT